VAVLQGGSSAKGGSIVDVAPSRADGKRWFPTLLDCAERLDYEKARADRLCCWLHALERSVRSLGECRSGLGWLWCARVASLLAPGDVNLAHISRVIGLHIYIRYVRCPACMDGLRFWSVRVAHCVRAECVWRMYAENPEGRKPPGLVQVATDARPPKNRSDTTYFLPIVRGA